MKCGHWRDWDEECLIVAFDEDVAEIHPKESLRENGIKMTFTFERFELLTLFLPCYLLVLQLIMWNGREALHAEVGKWFALIFIRSLS